MYPVGRPRFGRQDRWRLATSPRRIRETGRTSSFEWISQGVSLNDFVLIERSAVPVQMIDYSEL